VAIGNDLDAWITDPISGMVSRVLLQDGTDGHRGDVLDFQLVPANAQPTAIALRYFGIRCFTEAAANRIGCLTWGGGTTFTVDVPTPASGLVDIVNGPGATPLSPDMWFAEHDAGKVGRLSIDESGTVPVATVVAEYPLPAGCKPNALTWTDGNVWWAAEGCGRIGWIDRTTGAVHTVDVNVGRPVSLASNLGEPGAWFVDAASDRLGRLTTAGGLSWFTPAVAGSQLTGVTVGPDLALYVTQLAGNSVARLPFSSYDPNAGPNAGRLTEVIQLPTAGAQPARITGGTDGNVWFTERGQPRLGVIYMATHCLYGKVTLAGLGTPVAAVAMTLTPPGAQGSAVTSTEGDYIFCGLAPGAYTVTPTSSTRVFTPASLAVTLGRSNLVGLSFVAK
jgi:virginiamycin B lyase